MPGTGEIVSRVVDNVSDGAIVLLHDSSPDGSGDRSQTVGALPWIINALRARGFEFGTLSTTTGARSGPTGPDVVIGQE
jgi:peptidoglycan-N-acetylglucosamine deacetylase